MGKSTLELRQYIHAKKQMFPEISVAEMVNEIRRVKKYKERPYHTIYRTVVRQFKRKSLEFKKRKKNKPQRSKKMMHSIPGRLQAVIDCNGNQIKKKDYK